MSRSFLLAALLAAASSLSQAQQTLEVITLRHATVDQVLPALRPFLEPGGVLTGQSGQLIVRTSPENLAELRRALETLDRPLRRLMISVRFDDASQGSRQSFGASGNLGSGRSEIEVRAQDSSRRVEERVDQRLQVVEGGHAYIFTGQSRALPQRQVIRTPSGVVAQDSFVIQEAASGFEVLPRLSGDRVFLDIAPQRERFGNGPVPGSMQSQRVASTVSGRLGEWFEIGGAASAAARDGGGIASASRSSASESRAIWVKVEEVR